MVRIYVATAGVSSVEAKEGMTVGQALERAGQNVEAIKGGLDDGSLELVLDGASAGLDDPVVANSVIIISGEWEAGFG